MTVAAIPKTLANLFADVASIGGHVELEQERLWSVFIPVLMTDGKRHDLMIGRIGYYVQDGKNHIGSSIHAIRDRLARHF